MIQNPILKGFHPDPSICRVGDDYFIAVSTFEWFPGVLIYKSRNLENWELVSRPLSRLSQLDMKGNDDSGGIFAPCLSYADGKFWLIYTDVKVVSGDVWKDGNNYLVTSETIDGEWSEPVFLNSSGFDPSLFHDEDGKKYITNMVWDHRSGNHRFYGISLQEYDHEQMRLINKHEIIFKGTDLGLTEAPHIYSVNGYYYLVTAEGGTSYAHAVTVARSRNINGPYEVHPSNPILSSWLNPEAVLQKAGHCSFVETQLGEWYLVHLASRPTHRKSKKLTEERGFCSLGRESAIQKMYWENDWPYVVGGSVPSMEVDRPTLEDSTEPMPIQNNSSFDDFEKKTLSNYFQTLRIPFNEEIGSLEENPGHLRLYGRESLHSKFTQSHVARRWQSMNFEASTKVNFEPDTFQQEAGLVCYYNTRNWVSIHVTRDEEAGKILNIMTSDNYATSMPIRESKIKLKENEPIVLKCKIFDDSIKFSYSYDDQSWNSIDFSFPTYKLSDDYGNFGSLAHAAFTGAFVGMYCIDNLGCRLPADFEFFKYEEL